MSGRHAFTSRFLDWPSLQPERMPAHRAPKHRADAPVDSCQWGGVRRRVTKGPCSSCAKYPRHAGTHRAEAAA
jgi:hypothetical protein